MRRPRVTLENFQEVYSFYEQHQPHPFANRLGHWAMSLAFRPKISFEDGAKETISSLLEKDARIIIAANHINNRDQYVVAASAQIEPTLRPMRGKTFIPAKEPLFQNPLLRRGVDVMGAMPAFRTKDAARTKNADKAENRQKLRSMASRQLIETAIARIDQGNHMAIFPEGTRNTVDPLRVQELKGGVGIIATGVSTETPIAVVPMGLCYGLEDNFASLSPAVHIGQPLTDRFEHPSTLTAELYGQLQHCVDQAAERKFPA